MWETGFVFHISMPRFWNDSLRCRRPVAPRRVRPLRVVFHPPPLRQNLCLLQRVKDLAVQKLIAQLPVEALTVPVLPPDSPAQCTTFSCPLCPATSATLRR